jgi:hypothetical protein
MDRINRIFQDEQDKGGILAGTRTRIGAAILHWILILSILKNPVNPVYSIL